MIGKRLTVTFFKQKHIRPDWYLDMNGDRFLHFFAGLVGELAGFGVEVEKMNNDAISIDIKSYADLLNSVRISSPVDGIASQCVGHIIGKSQNLDLLEDIRRAVNRVAFAPETIPPEDHNRRVCHNCGCGC